MRRALILVLALAGCDVATSPVGPTVQPVRPVSSGPALSAGAAAVAFDQVSRVMEPVAERSCRQYTEGASCDFQIRLNPDPKAPPNAYQSLDKQGRPVITFTKAILPTFRNRDEIAFVMGHEAAHHIRGHLQRQQRDTLVGAVLLGGIAAAVGVDASGVQQAQRVGASVGARSYSKAYELEADELGTLITARAGYSPRKGVEYFYRLPDPGDRFLGTHPPNNDRINVVQATISRHGLN